MLKTKMWLTAIVAILVVGVGMHYMRLPNDLSTGRKEQGVEVWVSYEPKVRPPRIKNDPYDPTVHVVVSIDGHQIEDPYSASSSSPWFRLVSVPTGSLLEVVASQQVGADLHCLIKRRGEEVDQDDAVGSQAKVKCTHLEEG